MNTPLTAAESASMIQVRGLCKGFVLPDRSRLEILRGVELTVGAGSLVAITGVSGSGKSTLLHLLGGLDQADQGTIVCADRELGSLSRRALAAHRNRALGFVFQFHYLLPELTVLENVAAPLLLQGMARSRAWERAHELLAQVDLNERSDFLPYRLSGGEKQRVAIARSLVCAPQVLLADEPTGNLDGRTGQHVFDLFRRLVARRGLTTVLVTHNPALAAQADRVYHLEDGYLQPA